MNEYQYGKAYQLISEFYGDRTAKRSGVPLIKHIDEGLEILQKIQASQVAMDAYCLHPLLQSDESFNDNWKTLDFTGVPVPAIILCVEYRRVANSYLSKDHISKFVGFTNEDVRDMLIADKVQNESDFAKYHEGKHERSAELREYFDNWFKLLGVQKSADE